MGQSAMLAKRHAPGDAGTPVQSGNGHLFVRFDRRKWVVEVVKGVTPLLILVGPTEPLGVIFDTLPFHQQQVTGRGPDTPFQTNGPASWHRGDDRAGRAERLLEVLHLPWDDVEYGVLKDHRGPHCGRGLDRFGLEACGGHAAPTDPAKWDSPAAVPAGRCILAARVRLPPGGGGGRLPVLLRSAHRYPMSRAMSYLPAGS